MDSMPMSYHEDAVFSSITLPCGRALPNRLVKVALYEHLGGLLVFGGPPNKYHLRLYSKWSMHDWGMIITGNVQVSPQHLCLARDVVVPRHFRSESTLQPFKKWADAIHGDAQRQNKPLAIMQLSHAGRQSPNAVGGRFPFVPPLGPSRLRLGSSAKDGGFWSTLLHRLMFQVPRPMSLAEIDEVVQAFVRGANLAVQAGFDGVQLHGAHGYLLAQFMSAKSNKRTDSYGEDPLRLLHRIVVDTRAAVPDDFVLGLKINSADYEGESRALEHIRIIAEWGLVDFIEISGGDYEKPDFLASPSTRQTIFAAFASQALKTVSTSPRPPLILLTGGLTTPAQLQTALSSQHADLLGLGRAAVLRPDLPSLLKRNCSVETAFASPPDLRLPSILSRMPRIRLLGAGTVMAWYVVALRRLASTEFSVPDYDIGALGGIWWMWAWLGPEMSEPRVLVGAGLIVVAALVFAAAAGIGFL
ncbi:Nadph dehydrogenase [Favolaschia claudopus]|uniref:Nadph dehydrogenase n=1 Tax=Favolaschia claudopus TaxID=2862362 RepID=A0AAW0CPH6_9AGAR